MSVQREGSYITFNKSITFVSLALGEQIMGICKGLNISEYLNILSLNYNIHMFILILPHELLLLSAFANRKEWGNYARKFFKYSNYCKTAFGFSAALSATFNILRHAGNWDRPALRLRLSCLKTDLPEVETALLPEIETDLPEIETDLPEIDILSYELEKKYQPNEGLIV